MKHLLWIPLAIAAVAGAAALVLHLATGDPHARELAFAAGITILSAELSLIPLTLAKSAGPVAQFQAAFGGTLLHLFVTLVAGAAVYGLGFTAQRQTFLFLLLGAYWFSLVFVVIAMARVFRRSNVPPAAPQAAVARN